MLRIYTVVDVGLDDQREDMLPLVYPFDALGVVRSATESPRCILPLSLVLGSTPSASVTRGMLMTIDAIPDLCTPGSVSVQSRFRAPLDESSNMRPLHTIPDMAKKTTLVDPCALVSRH